MERRPRRPRRRLHHGSYGQLLEDEDLLQQCLGNCGTKDPSSVDYHDYSNILVDKIKNNLDSMGILLCGTGIGMSIAANRYPHIRAALCTNEDMARLSRQHNDANVLVIGGRTTSLNSAKKIIDVFVSTEFEKGRHTKRLKKIS